MHEDYFFALSKHTVGKRLYEAMKQGSVKMSIIKCLVLGIAGVGKTHLKRLLLSDATDGTTARVSTGLADNPVQAFVGSISSILAGVDEDDSGKWEVTDDYKLTQILTRAYHVEPLPSATTPSQLSYQQQSQTSTSGAVHESIHVDIHTVSTSSTSHPEHVISEDEDLPDQAPDEAAKLFIEAFKNITETKILNLKLVHFIDSGGQPQFLDLLPAFVHHISAILFAVNLSESLDHTPMIYFYRQDGMPVGEPYQSLSSHKRVFEQCVRATDIRDVHPKVYVVGTHRDMENDCSEKRKDKDEMVGNIFNPKYLMCKTGTEVIWEVNGKTPDEKDQKVAHKLRRSIVPHCSKGTSPPLPMKWFVLEMRIRESASRGVISLQKCLLLAHRLGMDEQSLEAALLHMVKYNLFLWYHNVPGLRDVVFSDPQAILQIITDLVQCKHELGGGDVPEALSSEGVKHDWCVEFRDHAIISHEFLSHGHFKRHYIYSESFHSAYVSSVYYG